MRWNQAESGARGSGYWRWDNYLRLRRGTLSDFVTTDTICRCRVNRGVPALSAMEPNPAAGHSYSVAGCLNNGTGIGAIDF
jgi:hypothetical protein